MISFYLLMKPEIDLVNMLLVNANGRTPRQEKKGWKMKFTSVAPVENALMVKSANGSQKIV